ncbi:hypothetical protein SAMN05216389_11497 [Oceanobacillus limi]|uniref:Uncharacterized protein n=1 Tax=Oceanobacillus limi TaxID=930131 RepID=A0A1I0FB33_9BACI|nr:hypothetical protein [Oceanobacillus limi]SET55331.1 hypothetical protein SAMN05216389_11497 [Oceanobacillus limi]
MTYPYYPGSMPVHYGNYQQAIPYMNLASQGWSQQQPQMMGINQSTGNVCAYAPNQAVQYNKLHVMHWPSDDYKKPHPKGFTHTMHTKQYPGQYVPYRQ